MDFPVWVQVSTAGQREGGVDIQAWCVRIKGLGTQKSAGEAPCKDSLKKFRLLWQLEILSVEQTYGRANCLSVCRPLPLFQYESRDY